MFALCLILQVLGTAVGLNLLLKIPMLLSVLLLALDSVIVLVILPIVVIVSILRCNLNIIKFV